MKNTRKTVTNDRERGQILVIFSFMLVILLIMVMAVVDVGFYLHERAVAQQTADAAALAGAQELPDYPELAEDLALEYVEANGMDPDDVTISFSCTSDSAPICLDGDGRYDTIRITPTSKAPSFFGGLLKLVGAGDLCWVDGCDVEASAAGCRGLCGPVGNAPVDSVFIIDRSGSMTNDDLTNAKDAAKSILEFFDPDLQRVGLGVLGSSYTDQTCTGGYSGGLGKDAPNGYINSSWLPIEMTDDYQLSGGSLNNNSLLVKTINCLEHSSVGTNLGSPVKAAADHLAAEGREDVVWGLVLLTDGAANEAPTTTVTTSTTASDDTGWNYCDNEQPVTSGSGDNNGVEGDRGDLCDNGSGAGDDDNSGNGTSTSCTSNNKDRHDFWDFDIDDDIPSSATAITGMEVRVDAWANGSGTRRICVDYSTNSGSNWTSFGQINMSGSSEQMYTLGSDSNLEGMGWNESTFGDDSFRIRLTMVSSNNSVDFDIDTVAVRVHYEYEDTDTDTVWDGHLGPCDYAMQQATAAKALGIEIYTIGYGLGSSDTCDDEYSDSEWDGEEVTELLEAMATDADHFFEEPQGEDLESVFQTIGGLLTAGGSRLVE